MASVRLRMFNRGQHWRRRRRRARASGGAAQTPTPARGTLRLAIKLAGLDPKRLTLHQLEAVFDKVMPGQLDARGIDESGTASSIIMKEIARTADASITNDAENADEIFRRLGGQ